jgi:aldehyde:ferredoxin oxidoreductase
MQPILTVDLSTGSTGRLDLPGDWERDYLGGASLAARILYDQLDLAIDPLAPDAPLLFLTGPLTGTAGPATGRFVICERSPATGLWGESNCGGFWGPELRMAGYDGLLVTGRAPEPVYLWIRDGRVELRPAGSFWGMDTYQVQSAIQAELGVRTARVACIGPAGEAQIPFALILCDHGRVAGRTGMGAVMGSKNLKAVAVKGRGKVPVADPDRYAPLRAASNRTLRAEPVSRVLHDLGSGGAAEYFDYLGEMPKRYFHRSKFPREVKISGASMKETILTGETTCHACVIACGRVVRLKEGEERKGPEYETNAGFGPNLWLNDLDVTTRLGELCDRYGMDTISLSNTIGLAFWLFEKGVIGQVETAGIPLEWGDARTVEKLVHLTARREGFGACLAEGARALGRRYGAEHEAVQVNGLEVAYHDPRGCSGMALVYATSPRGACHNQSDYFLVDLGQAENSLGLDYFEACGGAEKAANVARHQDWRTVTNSLVMCFFANLAPESVLALVDAACGLDWDLNELMQAGERAWNLKRAINHRMGLTGQNDRLPQALLVPYEDDHLGVNGFAPDFKPMLAAYYMARGWDPESGFPLPGKLSALGLGWLAEDLAAIQESKFPQEKNT